MRIDTLVFAPSHPAPASKPAAPLKVAPRECPGLTVTASAIVWVDSRGASHDLLREKRYSPGDAALIMGRSVEWVLRKIRANELFPVVKYNSRTIEIWQCGLEDLLVRNLGGRG